MFFVSFIRAHSNWLPAVVVSLSTPPGYCIVFLLPFFLLLSFVNVTYVDEA